MSGSGLALDEHGLARLIRDYGQDAVRLPGRIVALAERWGLEDLSPIPGSLTGALLAAQSPQGEVVLKLAYDSGQLRREAAVLRVWAPLGRCPRVWAESDGAYLMERIRPGQLWRGPDSEVLTLLADLHAEVRQTSEPLPRADALLIERLERAERALANDAAAPLGADDFALARELVLGQAEVGEETVLHNDLHPRSLLVGPDGAVLIDPLPCRGPAAFDLAAWVGKWGGPEMATRVRVGAAALDYDYAYVLAMARALAIEGAAVTYRHRLLGKSAIGELLAFARGR